MGKCIINDGLKQCSLNVVQFSPNERFFFYFDISAEYSNTNKCYFIEINTKHEFTIGNYVSVLRLKVDKQTVLNAIRLEKKHKGFAYGKILNTFILPLIHLSRRSSQYR